MKRKGVVDFTGLVLASAFGILLGLIAVFTQNPWISALIGSLTYLVVMIKEGILEIRG